MRGIVRYIFIFLLLFTLSTCKKKTAIEVQVYSEALGEYVPNATVALIEKHESGLFASDASCKEIAHATTDANGKCGFNKEKLRTNSSYEYFVTLTNAYGVEQSYPCGGLSTNALLSKGKTQAKVLSAGWNYNAYVRVQYNNLLSPSQPGDSLILYINAPRGGGVFYAGPFYGANGFPYPNIVLTSAVKTDMGKNTVHILKRKMGVVTTNVDTVKIYPNETKTIEIDW